MTTAHSALATGKANTRDACAAAGKLPAILRFWWSGGFCGFAGFRRRAAGWGCDAGNILIRRSKYFGRIKRFGMIGQFFAHRRDLLRRNRTGVVSPLASLI